MRILAINPGSTSTKFAVFEDKKPIFTQTIRHNVDELAPYPNIPSQYEYRKHIILKTLEENGISLQFDAIIGRGGLVKPVPGGTYEVNDALLHDLTNSFREHASNLGGLIASELANEMPGCRAFIADPIVVDELEDIARITGSPLLPHLSIFHALNHKAIARRHAEEQGEKYEDLDLIVCHMGGGISIGAHHHGKVIDVNNGLDGDGPFSPERTGTLPAAQLVNLCYDNRFTREEMLKKITGQGGIVAHLGTNNVIEVIERIENGDEDARLILDAMIYNTAKTIGSFAVVLKGKIDGILITGGIAHSDFIVSRLKEYISFLAPVYVYPGEDELEALAGNALGVLTGEHPVRTYV